MALLAETLVEEWLNRAGFFTIRGVRFGVSEMDLLAVRPAASGFEARHIEVQVSTNPVAYISPLTGDQSRALGKAKTSAWARPQEVLQVSVAAWVEKKFLSPAKAKARTKAWPGLEWSFEFVHGEVRHPEELKLIEGYDIKTRTFHSVLTSLCGHGAETHKGGAGTDIAEMLAYYLKHSAHVG
jgi:hypothetical protein